MTVLSKTMSQTPAKLQERFKHSYVEISGHKFRAAPKNFTAPALGERRKIVVCVGDQR